MRSLVLQPGHSRSVLADYIVESLSVKCRHFDTDSSLHGFRVLPCLGLREGRFLPCTRIE